MAGFKTHITTSTLLGIGYGGAALAVYDFPLPACVLAGSLCSVSGMLPDLDSLPGVPLRESLAFAAAVVPMLLIDRARHLGMSPESIALAGGLIYLAIRFGVGWLLRRFTVHRGMFHSVPAALIAGEIAFLVCCSGDLAIRGFKAGAVVVGYVSHLLLDELYGIEWRAGRVKRSFGSALKIWGDSAWANVAAYAQLVLCTLLVLGDPIWVDVSPTGKQLHEVAAPVIEEVWR